MGFHWLAAVVLTGTVAAPSGMDVAEGLRDIEARVWTDRGDEPLVFRGDRVRIYYRTTSDAYISILNINTDGTVRLVYPRSPDDVHYARAGRDYRLLFPRSEFWRVEDSPGMGYFFIVASSQPFDFSAFGYSRYAGGWDLSNIGDAVYSDPYQAIDDYVTYLVPDWEYADYAIDFATYHVDRKYEYPRFMCYQCHGFRAYASWNPYHSTCTNFTVVAYNDPYYYPGRRYRGDRVVFAKPVQPFRARFEFKERARGERGRVVVRTRSETDRDAVRQPPRRARPRSEPVAPTRAVPRTGTPESKRPQRAAPGGTTRRTAAPVTVERPRVDRPTDRARPGTRRSTTEAARPRATRRSEPQQLRPPPPRARQARPTLQRRENASTGARSGGATTSQTRARSVPARAQARPAPARPKARTAPTQPTRARPPAGSGASRATKARAKSGAAARPPTRRSGGATKPPRRGGSGGGSGGR